MDKKSPASKKTSLLANLKSLGVVFVATGGFVGFVPVAPGTAGALVGLVFVWWMKALPISFLVIASLLLSAIGVWASGLACQVLKKEDPGQVVIDEIVGMMITMIGIPLSPYWLVVGFIVFRVLDIVKPPPANYFDSELKGGWGVMLDDIMSGIYGNLLLRLMLKTQI